MKFAVLLLVVCSVSAQKKLSLKEVMKGVDGIEVERVGKNNHHTVVDTQTNKVSTKRFEHTMKTLNDALPTTDPPTNSPTAQPTNYQYNPMNAWVECRVDVWSSYTPCSKSCGTGKRQRKRKFHPAKLNPFYEGDSPGAPPICTIDSSTKEKFITETIPCKKQLCPIDCVWGKWSNWKLADAAGHVKHTRSVAIDPQNGGMPCSGPRVQTKHWTSSAHMYGDETDHALCKPSIKTDKWTSCKVNQNGKKYKFRTRTQTKCDANSVTKVVMKYKQSKECGGDHFARFAN